MAVQTLVEWVLCSQSLQAGPVPSLHTSVLCSPFHVVDVLMMSGLACMHLCLTALLACLQDVTAADGDSILWWGVDIVDPAHSAPGLLEMQQKGLPEYW